MIIGGLFTAVYVGWLMKRSTVRDQLNDGSKSATAIYSYVTFCLRYIAPLAILLIFLHYVGLF